MTGICAYCGQTMMVDCEVEEMANKVATEECHCEEGREYRNMELWKHEAKHNIMGLTEDVGETATKTMMCAVDAIAAGECKKVAIKINERVSINIVLKKDCIDVERNYKEKSVLSAEKM